MLIEAKQITYQFPTEPEPLFTRLDLFLDNQLHGLVGRNGIGKSWLAAILAKQVTSSEGAVTHFCSVGYLPQGIGATVGSVADMLGVTAIQQASERITQGEGSLTDFELMEGN